MNISRNLLDALPLVACSIAFSGVVQGHDNDVSKSKPGSNSEEQMFVMSPTEFNGRQAYENGDHIFVPYNPLTSLNDCNSISFEGVVENSDGSYQAEFRNCSLGSILVEAGDGLLVRQPFEIYDKDTHTLSKSEIMARYMRAGLLIKREYLRIYEASDFKSLIESEREKFEETPEKFAGHINQLAYNQVYTRRNPNLSKNLDNSANFQAIEAAGYALKIEAMAQNLIAQALKMLKEKNTLQADGAHTNEVPAVLPVLSEPG